MATSQERLSECWYKDVCQRDNPCNTCIKYIEMSHLMETSNLPKAKQRPIKLSVPSQDRDAYARLSEIKNNMYDFVYGGNNLYIAGSATGNGKTSWAIKLMHNFFDEIWDGNGLVQRGLFVHVPTFLAKCKDFNTKDPNFELLKSQLMEVDLVIWDDIASTDMSAYDYSQLLPYIDHRLLSEYCNIYTGNYTDKDNLTKMVGERLASRIFTRNTEVVIFRSGDMR